MDRSRSSFGAAMANYGSPEGSRSGNTSGLTMATGTPDHGPATPIGTSSSKPVLVDAQKAGSRSPVTPTKEVVKKEPSRTPRVKKRVPWRGKNIMVLLPRDDDWGRPGGRPSLMKEHQVAGMYREWQELGYNTRGFDLNEPWGPDEHSALPIEHYSRSRDEWPDVEETRREGRERKFKVVLPDIDAWKRYVDELTEAKLRALGVSLADEQPPPAPPKSSSPNPSQQPLSRRATITQYPPLPYSPPIPTSSTSSQGLHQFPFPGPPTPGGFNGVASPASFNGGFNQQQQPPTSMPNQSPYGFMGPPPLPSPRDMMYQQQGMHRVSPSLSTSPFGQGGFQPPLSHQRHQSLQFPQLSHQQMPHQQFAPLPRSTPQLQEVREEEEEEHVTSPSKTPEPRPQVRHNSSDSLQKEIDEAEYHLEEQFRSQLEHDQDYSPHKEEDRTQGKAEPAQEFGPQAPHFETTIDDNLELHHPRPHSRGHSLTQKYFGEEHMRKSSSAGDFSRLNTIQDDKAGEELETNPSNLGTPADDKFPGLHDRTFSNPWQDVQSTSRRPSLESKPSTTSKFNVAAPEFKFNPVNHVQPTSTIQPGQFNFGSNTFQPAGGFQGVFPKGPGSVHSTSSKINVNAPVFSPGSSEFSFSAAGPTFRPDAPAFVPLGSSVSGSVTSPILSGSESGQMPSIFGHLDLNKPAIIKPSKASKAIPIVRPSSNMSNREDRPTAEDENGRIVDDSKPKRFRGGSADVDSEPLFAPQPTDRDWPIKDDVRPELHTIEAEEQAAPEPALSSPNVSESPDAKDTTSLSETSVAELKVMHWAPVNLRSDTEISDFNAARPFGEDFFQSSHQKALSATGKPITPETSVASLDDDKEDTPVPGHFDESLLQPLMRAEHSPSPVQELAEDFKFPRNTIEIEPSAVSPEDTEDPNFEQPRFVPSPSPVEKGLSASRFAAAPSPSHSPMKGLAASKHARSPSTTISDTEIQELQSMDEVVLSSIAAEEDLEDSEDVQEILSQPASPPAVAYDESHELREPTFEEIDEVMRHINEDPSMGVNKVIESPWHQPSPAPAIAIPSTVVAPESPKHIHPHLRDHAPSPSPRHYHLPLGAQHPLQSTELEDPFLDPPQGSQLSNLGTSPSQAASDDWERAFSDEEQAKLDNRAGFFDGRVNDLVDGVLDHRLGNLQHTLGGIQKALATLNNRPPSGRRERRSMSADIQESDADDEDDERPPPRRSISPRKDRRMEQIRAAVMEAMAAQQRSNALPSGTGVDSASAETLMSVLQAVEDMKQQFSDSLHLDFRGEDLRNVVEEAVASRLATMPAQPAIDTKTIEIGEELGEKFNELAARHADLEQRLRVQEAKNETEVSARRDADDRAAEFERQLNMAENRLEVEIKNRSIYDQRVVDLEDKLRNQESFSESEVQLRRAAEDRLSEIQRLLRISSEEEIRLRETLEDKEERLKIYDATNSRNTLRVSLLESAVENLTKDKAELEIRVNTAEMDSRDFRQEANRWRIEAERNVELSGRQGDDLHAALDEKKQLHVLIDTLGTQLNENERTRESWRTKFLSLQEDMERAAFEIAEEGARRIKKEQTMLARQEVLDAKLQAESRTRERLEVELERLEAGERQGMKAVNEAKRLDALLGEMRNENHKLQQQAMRYQATLEEARESAAREVQRARQSMQSQVDEANHHVNVVREQLEDQISDLQAQLDQAKLESDTVRSQYDMLVEGGHNSGDVKELVSKHQDELEDMQARFERQLNNTKEDAHRTESNLLERLSISTSKCEHLQDRVAHLEEKLDIAREAGRAAAQAAKASGYMSPPIAAAPHAAPQPRGAHQPAAQVQPEAVAKAMQLPEKISPQALRESIMVLQEQLQEREQKIEALEQIADPEGQTKIAKRDDEIIWLRELLGVRHSDLQDIITALGRDDYDQDRVRDAAIRLKANLQMEQQERERAMNGGSAINLPNIAASLRDATPRVAQAVGPFAAALGNWRKGGSFTSVVTSSASAGAVNATPMKDSPASQSSFLSGLLTPPQSGLRPQTPSAGNGSEQQATAFSSTGRRFTPQDLANRPKAFSARQAGKMPARSTNGSPSFRNNPQQPPQTPPMMRTASYDDDALAQDDFDDAGFFDDE